MREVATAQVEIFVKWQSRKRDAFIIGPPATEARCGVARTVKSPVCLEGEAIDRTGLLVLLAVSSLLARTWISGGNIPCRQHEGRCKVRV